MRGSAVNSPVMSGPKWRQNGLECLCAHEPVVTTEPSASTTLSPITLSATVPHTPEPWNRLFCESAPPTVA